MPDCQTPSFWDTILLQGLGMSKTCEVWHSCCLVCPMALGALCMRCQSFRFLELVMYDAICQRQGAPRIFRVKGNTSRLERKSFPEKAGGCVCNPCAFMHLWRRWSSLKDASNSRVSLEREMEGMQLPPRSIGSPVSDEDPNRVDENLKIWSSHCPTSDPLRTWMAQAVLPPPSATSRIWGFQ